MQLLSTLVSIKPGEPLRQATLLSLKANTTDVLPIFNHANPNIYKHIKI